MGRTNIGNTCTIVFFTRRFFFKFNKKLLYALPFHCFAKNKSTASLTVQLLTRLTVQFLGYCLYKIVVSGLTLFCTSPITIDLFFIFQQPFLNGFFNRVLIYLYWSNMGATIPWRVIHICEVLWQSDNWI